MATMIPEIALSDFKRLKASEMKRLKSAEITVDGEYLFTYINPQTGFIRASAESLGQLSNVIDGKSLEDIVKQEVSHANT